MKQEGNEIIAKQELFVLKRDMIPVNINEFGMNGFDFSCPLPKGFKIAMEEKDPDIEEIAQEIKNQINAAAKCTTPPFENILLGYHERTDERKRELLEQFEIETVSVDHRGVYSVHTSLMDRSGIYLSSNKFHSYICGLSALDHIFEPFTSWQCHNMDSYWQALLTREFCVRYFNYLNGLIFGNKKFSRQKKLSML